jgi:hypothetical protein
LTFSVYRRRKLVELDKLNRIVWRALNQQPIQMHKKRMDLRTPDYVQALLGLPAKNPLKEREPQLLAEVRVSGAVPDIGRGYQ